MKELAAPLRRFAKQSAIAMLAAYQARSIDHAHREVARDRYRSIVRRDPDRALSDTIRKQIADYAGDVLGSVRFAPWLETYAAFRGRFIEGWIPDNYIERFLVPFSSGRFGALGTRSLANRLLMTRLSPDIAYGVNGAIYDADFEPIEPSALAKRIFAETDSAFLKLEGTLRGHGVTRLDAASFDIGALPRTRDFVIQRAVRQHPFFDEISPGAAATLRITTVKRAGRKAEARGAVLKLGREGTTAVADAIILDAPVTDLQTGELAPYGVLYDWTRTDRHPDTGAEFRGKAIPAFRAAVDTCTSMHDRLPHVWYIGWDVCVTASGAVEMFEFNIGHAGVRLCEAAYGPCFLGLGWDRLHLRDGPALPLTIRPRVAGAPPAPVQPVTGPPCLDRDRTAVSGAFFVPAAPAGQRWHLGQ